MSLVDTHIHLYAEEYNSDRNKLQEAARHSGVHRMLLPNIDTGSLAGMLEICNEPGSVCRPMFGLHPCSVREDFRQQLEVIRQSLVEHKSMAVAIGETGLDFYWDLSFKKEQEIAFREQATWAVEFNLPLVIHSRNSTDELIAILEEIKSPRLQGVFHCFSGNLAQAQAIAELGFYMGIGGVVTFKNSGLDKILPDLPNNRIILETDGPYLAPVPFRGKRNEPAYLKIIAEKVAEVKGISFDELAKITSENADRLFNIPQS